MTANRLCRPLLTAAAVLLLLPWAAAAAEPLDADFTGVFVQSFGTGPDGTDDLYFAGPGQAAPLGSAFVLGHSTTRPDPDMPGCSEIVTDRVVLTGEGGDEIWLENSGDDCLDLSVPGRVFIRGTGTFAVVGGTGRYKRATGSGEFNVVAEVLQFAPDGAWAAGTFQLSFTGTVSRPGAR